jgi:hypothetical protein
MMPDLDTNHSAHVLIGEHDEAPLLKPLRAPMGCWSAMITRASCDVSLHQLPVPGRKETFGA